MLVVGLTGGIVSGKSTVAEMFRELGAVIIDADQIARTIVQPDKKAWRNIVHYFGKEILSDNQEINRKELAKIVFSDKEKLEILNKVTHPEIVTIIKSMIREMRSKDSTNRTICIIDVPLLFETSLEGMMDRIVVVYLSRKEQIRRLIIRNNLTQQEAIARIDVQMPLDEKLQKADYVIDNGFSFDYTKKQVEQVWQNLKQLPV